MRALSFRVLRRRPRRTHPQPWPVSYALLLCGLALLIGAAAAEMRLGFAVTYQLAEALR